MGVGGVADTGNSFAGRGNNNAQGQGGSKSRTRGKGGNRRPDTGYGSPRFSRALDVDLESVKDDDKKLSFYEWVKLVSDEYS